MEKRCRARPLLPKKYPCIGGADTGSLHLAEGIGPPCAASMPRVLVAQDALKRAATVRGAAGGRALQGLAERGPGTRKPYIGFPMDMFLVSIFGHERGVRFNFGLINSVILRFLDHKATGSVLCVKSMFRLANELPLTLVSGYIYLEKYVKKIGGAFGDCKELVKFFLVCCLIGSKLIHDAGSCSLTPSDLSMVPREASRAERAVLSAIDYDVEICNGDIRRVVLQNKVFLHAKESLDSCFDEAVRSH